MTSRTWTLWSVVVASWVITGAYPSDLRAQTRADTLPMGQLYERRDAMIPMRDGAQLYTEIYTPRNAKGPLPFLMERTPYDARSGLTHFRPTANGYSTRLYDHQELAREGYIFVFQDLRGRFRSTGEYQTLRPPRDRSKPGSIDESTDTYDTIDWLVKNVPGNNGRVGVLGISYGGFTSMRAMLEPHPALKATSPQASCADMFVGDDWHHNGAFRLDYSFRWLSSMERGKGRNAWDFGKNDSYDWFLELGPLSAVNERLFQGRVPSWTLFVEHPNNDEYWEKEMCGVLPFIHDLPVPTLTVAGWFDAEDFYGPLAIYKKLETFDRKNWNYLVIGPWTHGGWVIYDQGNKILDVDFGSNTAQYFREQIQAPWFAHWLKDKGALKLPGVLAFQTGSNKWESFDAWPPRVATTPRKLYLQEGGKLSFVPPSATGASYDQYVSDPSNPVPYRRRPIHGGEGWPEWQAQDQRPLVQGRADVLTWQSEPLREDLTITGDIMAHLVASTTGTDSDWIVKLIDVYPEAAGSPTSGYELMVAGEVFRARFRESFSRPVAVVANKPTEYAFSLRDRDHRFLKGHRIMVQVQSTWFPLIDLNPQTFVPNIFEARASDFQKATQRIYRSRDRPSYIALSVRTNGN